MAVKVLITRRFKPGKFAEANKLLMQLRSLATTRNGYVSGQTIVSTKEPNKIVVISTWASEKRWSEWLNNERRKVFVKKLEDYLEGPEQSEAFLVGGKPAEWVDMA